MAYRDLSIKERAAIIRAGVSAGVHNMRDIEEMYNMKTSPDNNPDYDMEGYIKENPTALFNHEGHYPDTYKLPNHPTFSDESKYHSSATPGGHWSREGFYAPSDYVLNRQEGWNNFLKRFYEQERGTGAVPVFRGGVMLPEIEVQGRKFEDGGDEESYSNIDYLSELISLLKNPDYYGGAHLSKGFHDKTIDLINNPIVRPIAKRIATRGMHQSPSANRSPSELKEAIFSKDKLAYTGGVEDVLEYNTLPSGNTIPYWNWNNPKRDLVSLFIKGKPGKRSDLRLLEGDNDRGFSYKKYIEKHYPGEEIRTYEGKFPQQGIIEVSPKGYALAKLLGTKFSNIGHYKEASNDVQSDNVASYRIHYNVWDGKPELVQTDLWDFGKDYNTKWNKNNYALSEIQNEVVTNLGTPFILKSINPIRISNTPNAQFENQMALDANAMGVMKYDAESDTYSPVVSLPEVTVSALYGNSIDDYGRETMLAKGGSMHIKPSKRGTFTAAASKHGKSVQAEITVTPNKFTEGGDINNREVKSNYLDAKDGPENILGRTKLAAQVLARMAQDAGWNPIGSGISNCTLTATQWIDPKNPIMNSRNIVNDPGKFGYVQVSAEDAVPGDLIIATDPLGDSRHTMLIEGFDKSNKPIVSYSKGMGTPDALVQDIPLDEYHRRDFIQGGNHLNDSFYRYLKNGIPLPEITVTPKQRSTGGPLYPFSFEKIPQIKTPVVRYKDTVPRIFDTGGELL